MPTPRANLQSCLLTDRPRYLMGNTWIVDLSHYLTSAGAFADMPSRARLLAEYFASIVVDEFYLDK